MREATARRFEGRFGVPVHQQYGSTETGAIAINLREKDGDTDYEEWIYGEPPQDVDFVRIIGDEVVRIETMKVGGEKIVRTEKEVILDQPDQDKEARKEQEERPPNAPSLRRPGEDADDVPKPANGRAPLPPPTMPSPTSPAPGNGPGDIVPATGR